MQAVSAFYSDWRGILPRLPSSSASSSASVDPPFIPVRVVTVLDEVKRRITEHVFHAVIDGPVHQAVLEGAKRFPGADLEPEDCLYVHKKNAIEEQLHPAFRTLVLEEDQDEEQEVELESESATSSSLGGPPGAGRHDDEPREPAAVQHEDSAGYQHLNPLNTGVARVSVSGVAVSFVEEGSGSGSRHSLDLLLGLDEGALDADQEEAVKAVLRSLAEMVAGITKLCAHRSLEGLRLDVMGAEEGEADNISGFAGAQYYVPQPLLTRLPAREAKAQEQGQAGRRSLKATTGAVGKPFYRNPCTSGQNLESLCGPSRTFSGLLMLGPLGVATGDQDSPTKCRKSGGSSRDEVLEIKADDSTEDECALRMSRSGGLKRVEDVVPDPHTEAVLADHTAKMNHSSDDPFGTPTPTYHMPMAVRTPKPSAMEALFGDHVVDLDQVLANGSVASAAPWFVEDTPLDVHTLRAQAGC
eukprot:g6098.t1